MDDGDDDQQPEKTGFLGFLFGRKALDRAAGKTQPAKSAPEAPDMGPLKREVDRYMTEVDPLKKLQKNGASKVVPKAPRPKDNGKRR